MKTNFKNFFALSLGFLIFIRVFSFAPAKAQACTINDVNIRPHGVQPITNTTVATPNDFPGANNQYRDSAHGYPAEGYDSDNPGFPPHVYVDISTSGCQTGGGSTIGVAVLNTVYENQVTSLQVINPVIAFFADLFSSDVPFESIYHIGPGTPQPPGHNTTSDSFTVDLKAGETGCAQIAGYDCQYFFAVYGNNGAVTHVMGTGAQPELEYDCDGTSCLDNWSGGNIIGYQETSDPPGNILDPNYNNSYFSTGYDLPLAPLPGVNPSTSSTLGGFLKALFSVLIVIAGILAFIMIVIGGVTYATSDAFSDKSAGKEMILNAILGLIIALGSWIILNTINPNLASNLSITIPKAMLDAPREEWQNGSAPVGTNIAHNITLNGQPITQGMAWPSDSQQRAQLAAPGVNIPVVSSIDATDPLHANCTPTAGIAGCTSVYFEPSVTSVISQIIAFKASCGCDIIITGGSEAWLHQTHGPNVKVVDMRATTSLNAYLNTQSGASGDAFPERKWININGVGKFWAEPSGASAGATEHHWHVIFN